MMLACSAGMRFPSLIFLIGVLLPSLVLAAKSWRRGQISGRLQQLVIQMNGYSPDTNDDYVATTVPAQAGYIVRFEPIADAERVHHMLLYGCTRPYNDEGIWKGMATCASGTKILYAWARNAPDLVLPPEVAFSIGHTDDTVQHLVLQVHYSRPFAGRVRDFTGVRLHLSQERPARLAAVFLFASGTSIPPGQSAYYTNMSCTYSSSADLFPFAFRTHTHAMGRVVSAFFVHDDQWTMIGKRNPQWPQLFQPITERLVIRTGDRMAATCRFDSADKTTVTNMGSMGMDEMCNFYMMYSWNASQPDPFPQYGGCFGGDVNIPDYPESGHTLLPPHPDWEHHAHQSSEAFGVVEHLQKRVLGDVRLGQVSGLAFDTSGNLVVFHRGRRVWNGQSFDFQNRLTDLTPIKEATLLVVRSDNLQLLHQYGANMFYMPHGVFVDRENAFYTTDVGAHQVRKWRIRNNQIVSEWTLGEQFVPGSDQSHFCKPAAVTVSADGSVFVADGYCNNRVMKFDRNGAFVAAFGTASSVVDSSLGTFSLPHDIVVDANGARFFVADRMNGRVQSFRVDGTPISLISHKSVNNVYSADVHEDVVYFIPGEISSSSEGISAFAASSTTNLVSYSWQPNTTDFVRPHILRVHANGLWIFVGEIADGGGLVRQFHLHKEKMNDNVGKASLSATTREVSLPQVADQTRLGTGTFLLLAVLLSAGFMLGLVWRWRRAELAHPQLLLDRTGFKPLRMEDADGSQSSDDDEAFFPPAKS